MVEAKKSDYEGRRDQTIRAYQEKEKWNIQKARLESDQTKEVMAWEMKTADELAVQKYLENHQDMR